ncbi:sugar ABC transporter substrate-binding protein [Litorivita sp. NS0012-18]|uniref:sugar ABC transporter substrate-binding protein n=1 Tax=Litorivita sp. NS0012-18 TaxID=3127655 RepID=UPI003102D50B
MTPKALKTLGAAALTLLPFGAGAQGIDDPSRAAYFDEFKGKTIAFVPASMGIDLTEGWAKMMKREADKLGMNFIIRDAQWSSDVGSQAITSLIGEKPDVMVVHNPDVQSYARLLKKAEKAGIKVLQVNMKSSYGTDAYVGADWVGIGEEQARAAVSLCGEGTSKKIQIVQGVLTAAASAYTMKGVENVLSQHPEIEVVSNQAADWDATKARNVTATVIQQHPDLCGSIGFWDVMDTGTAAALKEADKTDVHLITSGGGAQMACDNIETGLFDVVISYDVPTQGNDLNTMIRTLIQQKTPAGETKVALYSPTKTITKDTMNGSSCWTIDTLQ